MNAASTEIEIRGRAKQVLKYLEEGQAEKAQEVILANQEVLHYNLGLANFDSLIPRIRFSRTIPKNYDALKMLIDTGFQIFSKEENVDELLFFAAAKCDTQKLKSCVEKIVERDPDSINQTREGDTALMFLIKFGNLTDANFPKCLKILIEAGIDVNKNDYLSQTPISFLANICSKYSSRARNGNIVIQNLKKSIELLLETKAVDLHGVKHASKMPRDILRELNFEGLDYDIEKSTKESEGDELFKLLILGDQESFKKSKKVKNLLDIDDGNNTLLQLCCQKNLKEAAQFLIDSGANVSKTTTRNAKSPLEIAARRNHSEIFDALLKSNKIIVDEAIFLTFLRNRPRHIKAKYFDEILKCKNLDVAIRSNNGNTPLHYAIIFSCREAVASLLQRGASLIVKNHSMKCPLDYMTSEDLEAHLDRCVLRDNYNNIDSGKYEVALNYRSLIEVNESDVKSELAVLEKICSSPKLSCLLNHPLISSFIDIKWKLVESLYRKVFGFQIVFFLITTLSYINLNVLDYIGMLLVIVYGARIKLFFNWQDKTLHEVVDIAIAVILMLSVNIASNAARYQLGIIVAVFMSFSLHLFWSFSPKFSEFHAVLINMTSQLLSYISYVFALTLFFGAASYIFMLIQYDSIAASHDDLEVNIFIFSNSKMLRSHFYLLCALSVFISVMIVMTIINCIIYVREHISDDIMYNFKIVGQKNVLIFLKCVEELHRNWNFPKNLFIFNQVDGKDQAVQEKSDNEKRSSKKISKSKNKNRFFVHFFVNGNKFSVERLLSVKLSDLNVSKIKKFVK